MDSVSVFGEVEPIPEYDKGDTEKGNQLTFYIYTKYNVLYNKYKVIGTCQYLYDIRKKKTWHRHTHVNVGIERFLKSCPKMYKTKKEKEV